MNIVFDEEQRMVQKDEEIAAMHRTSTLTPVVRKTTLAQNVMMILFAIFCIAVTVAVWYYKPSSKPIPSIYKEEVQTNIKFVPEGDREALMESLPSIEKNQ